MNILRHALLGHFGGSTARATVKQRSATTTIPFIVYQRFAEKRKGALSP